jgi:hypothetical protein
LRGDQVDEPDDSSGSAPAPRFDFPWRRCYFLQRLAYMKNCGGMAATHILAMPFVLRRLTATAMRIAVIERLAAACAKHDCFIGRQHGHYSATNMASMTIAAATPNRECRRRLARSGVST